MIKALKAYLCDELARKREFDFDGFNHIFFEPGGS